VNGALQIEIRRESLQVVGIVISAWPSPVWLIAVAAASWAMNPIAG